VMWHFRLQRVSVVVLRCLRSMAPRRAMTSVDACLLAWRSVGTSQRGVCARCSVG
jgi:hypothetical protein